MSTGKKNKAVSVGKRSPAGSTKPSGTSKRSPAGSTKPSGTSKQLNELLLTDEQALFAYREMLLIRRFEERTGQMYSMGLIGGFCHLYIGQEAVVVGMQMTLQEGDQVITSYRDHGHMLACGMSSRGIMAELMGRKDGYSKGKGGSMHMFSFEKSFYGGHGIVGAQVPLGTGLAFANRYRNNDHVCLTYFGEGAINQGQVYESFNLSLVWKLPVVYIIENNRYAMGTDVKRLTSCPETLFERGSVYGIPGRKVDGMDVHAVKAAGDEAVAYCRGGGGPVILEMETYRYRGHSMSDPAKYRTKEEVQTVRDERDAIMLLRKYLLQHEIIGEDNLKAIEKEIRDVVLDAVEFARASPEPDASELWTDMWR